MYFYQDLAKCHTFTSACFYQSNGGGIVSCCFLIFLISNCSWCYLFFLKVSLRLPHLPLCLESSLSLCFIWRRKNPGKLSKTPGKLLENSWNLSGKNDWPPWIVNYLIHWDSLQNELRGKAHTPAHFPRK